MQTEHGMDSTAFTAQKQELRKRLSKLAEELDRYLARVYGVNFGKSKDFEQWRKSHQPFHWFAEFYGIMNDSGFGVVIGNPPYVSYAKVREKYRIIEETYRTMPCGNLYAYVTERTIQLIRSQGRLGIILPLSSTNANGNSSLQTRLHQVHCLHIAESF
jgi:hypothetical protein